MQMPMHTLMHTELLGACNLIGAMTRIGKLNQGEWFNLTRELADEDAFAKKNHYSEQVMVEQAKF